MQSVKNSKENRAGQPLPTDTTETPCFGVIVSIFAIGVLTVRVYHDVFVRPRKSLEISVMVACTEKRKENIQQIVNFLVGTLSLD